MKFLKLFLLLISVNLTAQESRFKEGETINVWAASGLNMRDKPDAKAAKVATIPYGAKVSVQPNIGIKIPFEIEEFKGFTVKGYWLLVKYGNTEGFVFDGFLSRLPAPNLTNIEGLEAYLNNRIGKVGKKFDIMVYKNNTAEVRNTLPNEKIDENKIRDFKQKYNYDLLFIYNATESTSSYEFNTAELTFYELYFLVKTFYYDVQNDSIIFDKTEKAILFHADCGCSSIVKKKGKKIVAFGGCGC